MSEEDKTQPQPFLENAGKLLSDLARLNDEASHMTLGDVRNENRRESAEIYGQLITLTADKLLETDAKKRNALIDELETKTNNSWGNRNSIIDIHVFTKDLLLKTVEILEAKASINKPQLG